MLIRSLTAAILDLFDGGAAAGAAGAGSGTGTGDGAASGGNQGDAQGAVPGNTRRGKSGDLSNVVYGKQPQAASSSDAGGDTGTADVSTTSNTLEERRKAYQQMVNGEYKDLYTEDTQRIIDRRFRETKQLQDTVGQYQPLVDMLMQRYKVEGNDIKALTQAIENDDAYWSEAAEENGMTVEQYKQFQKLQRDNRALLDEQRRRQGQEAMQQQVAVWSRDAEALKAKYPAFDLNAELGNPEFARLLKSNVPMEQAYRVLHMDEIVTDAVSATAAETERKVVNNVRARGTRPVENGASSQSAFTVKDDVSKLTKKDRAEIARRAAMGETITF